MTFGHVLGAECYRALMFDTSAVTICGLTRVDAMERVTRIELA